MHLFFESIWEHLYDSPSEILCTFSLLNKLFINPNVCIFTHPLLLFRPCDDQGQRANPCVCREIHASGHDLHSLLYSFLDETLFLFHTEMQVASPFFPAASNSFSCFNRVWRKE